MTELETESEEISLTVHGKELRVTPIENGYSFPTLYTRNSRGKLSTWKAWTEGDTYYRVSGLVDGKQRAPVAKTVVGKNIGKANETSPNDQALLECFSYWNKQIDKGYQEDQDSNCSLLFPMLAQQLNNKIKYPCAVSPKLDGKRMLAMMKDGEVVFSSRLNKPVHFLNHIRDELKEAMMNCAEEWGDDVILDGELYSHSSKFGEIISMASQKNEAHPEESLIEYHVFDIYETTLAFSDRFAVLEGWFANLTHVKLVQCSEASNKEEIIDYHTDFVGAGYEGVIVRNWDGMYLLGKSNRRSPDLQKYKEFDDSEYEIIDAKEGEGTETGAVVWMCKTPSGEIFETRPRGTIEERRELYERKDDLIGQKLTVRYQGFETKDIPRFPVGICIRNYE